LKWRLGWVYGTKSSKAPSWTSRRPLALIEVCVLAKGRPCAFVVCFLGKFFCVCLWVFVWMFHTHLSCCGSSISFRIRAHFLLYASHSTFANFSIFYTYTPPSFSGFLSPYANRRRWRVYSLAAPKLAASGGLPAEVSTFADEYPFAVPVETKLTAKDVLAMHRDHYEGMKTKLWIFVCFCSCKF